MSLAVRSAVCSTLRTSAPRAARQQQARRTQVVRASSDEQPASTSGTFFYKGKSYSEAEWKEAVANGTVNQAAATPTYLDSTPDAPAAAAKAVSIGDLMAFSGPAPELINGRLAMLAFVAALGAELSSGETVLRQLADEPTGVILAAIAFISASFIPMMAASKREAFGPFTPAAEMLNGRAAMIGFASLLVVEAVRGSALF